MSTYVKVKDKNLRIIYSRTDEGGLWIGIYRGKFHIANVSVNADNRVNLDMGINNTASVFVYPPSALTRKNLKAEPQERGEDGKKGGFKRWKEIER